MMSGCVRALRHRATAATIATSLLLPFSAAAHAATDDGARPIATEPVAAPLVQLSTGTIAGTSVQDGSRTLSAFLGVPYAAPPTGSLRWREPQPLARWSGVRAATQFGPRCMQPDNDRRDFRSTKMSEDCLYLNVWTRAASALEKLPVLVHFHSGGLQAGDSSEARYDGTSLAARGIVMVSVNYRLGVFGFLALPEAAHESPYGAAGNYGLLDQQAALRWVRDNIAQFGGDPDQVTMSGDSAGSIAVSAHMASPLSRGLFARAIGLSGGAFAPIEMWHRARVEQTASEFAEHVGAASLQQLREILADDLLASARPEFLFWPHVDGHFLTDTPEAVFRSGGQARVPLLLGTNSQERHPNMVLGRAAPTPEAWRHVMNQMFREQTDEALSFYPGGDDEEVIRSATALANDLSVSHSAWRWMDLHRQTGGGAPVYFYYYTHPRPAKVAVNAKQKPQKVMGALQGPPIEYALANLHRLPQYAWQREDHKLSAIFSSYIVHFVRTGNPSSQGKYNLYWHFSRPVLFGYELPPYWPAVHEEKGGLPRQEIGTQIHTMSDRDAARQAFMQRFFARSSNDTAR